MIVFIDESGDHSLQIETMDPFYKVFVLGAVCFEEDDYAQFDMKFRSLKQHFFGTDSYVLHTAQITRPGNHQDPLTHRFINKEFRINFYTEMNELISDSSFNIVSCIIHKDRLLQKYKESSSNPYYIALENILNRILWKCKSESYSIYPEERSANENKKLLQEYQRIQTKGAQFHDSKEILQKISEFRLVKKRENHSGSQLIDLLVTPLGRKAARLNPKPQNEITIQSFRDKFPPKCLTIFPKKMEAPASQ